MWPPVYLRFLPQTRSLSAEAPPDSSEFSRDVFPAPAPRNPARMDPARRPRWKRRTSSASAPPPHGRPTGRHVHRVTRPARKAANSGSASATPQAPSSQAIPSSMRIVIGSRPLDRARAAYARPPAERSPLRPEAREQRRGRLDRRVEALRHPIDREADAAVGLLNDRDHERIGVGSVLRRDSPRCIMGSLRRARRPPRRREPPLPPRVGCARSRGHF